MGKMSAVGVPSAALGTGSSDSAPPSAVSRDKPVRRSAQDDVFVGSWRCTKPASSRISIVAEQVSAYGAQPLSTLLLSGQEDCGKKQEPSRME
jgi:hypothetical protein